MITARARFHRTTRVLAASSILALALAACGGGGGGDGSGKASGEFTFLGLSDNQTPATTLQAMSTTTCKDANATSALKPDSVPQAQLDQKIQLLVGQGALPSLSVSAGTPDLVKKFIESGQLVDVTEALGKNGQSDALVPAAASVIKALYGQDDVYALPNELNIEGIWFNKKIFAEQKLTPPATWDDLVATTKKLQAAGVQPWTADGKDGWNVTRFVGMYLFRSLGPDALKKVADGQAKLTDPSYVKAADEVAALGKAGAFGKGVASTDYNGAVNEFLTGKAAMIYMGSWVLSNLNDPQQNKIGADAIGFAPFPTVAGGAGTADQVPANVGQPLVLSKQRFDQGAAAWLRCIADGYGDTVLDKSGVISGFKLHQQHQLNPLTQTVQDQITAAASSVLWFEALFSAKATTTSQSNGGALGNGSLSGADFMKTVQDSL